MGAAQATNEPKPASSAFGNFSIKGASHGNDQQASFKPLEQFKLSLAEVSRSSKESKWLYHNAPPNSVPDKDYLKAKRTSVFHRAFESKDNVENFKAPIYEKSHEDLDSLKELFKTSFLTKNIDASQHIVLANAM